MGFLVDINKFQKNILFLWKVNGKLYIVVVLGLCPVWATKNVVVREWIGKEFPNMRQNEREIKFIRVGDTVRTAGQLNREPMLSKGP